MFPAWINCSDSVAIDRSEFDGSILKSAVSRYSELRGTYSNEQAGGQPGPKLASVTARLLGVLTPAVPQELLFGQNVAGRLMLIADEPAASKSPGTNERPVGTQTVSQKSSISTVSSPSRSINERGLFLE